MYLRVCITTFAVHHDGLSNRSGGSGSRSIAVVDINGCSGGSSNGNRGNRDGATTVT
jgi:hypothetical protein